MSQMILCARCKRHVFASESSCPFCALVFAEDAQTSESPPSWAPRLSRAERYALGTAIALTLASTSCKKDEGPVVEPESANTSSINAAPTESPKAEKAAPAPLPTPTSTVNDAPPSPFLVGSPAAAPTPPTTTVADAQTTAPKKPPPPPLTVRRPPPPPPPPDDFGEENGWRGRHRCRPNGNGQMVCPPYGCVFPDEACDIERV